MKRGGKKASHEAVEKLSKERTYGKTYSNHYKEEFIKTTNKKLIAFLKEQGFLRE